jgi:hypothetical protein
MRTKSFREDNSVGEPKPLTNQIARVREKLMAGLSVPQIVRENIGRENAPGISKASAMSPTECWEQLGPLARDALDVIRSRVRNDRDPNTAFQLLRFLGLARLPAGKLTDQTHNLSGAELVEAYQRRAVKQFEIIARERADAFGCELPVGIEESDSNLTQAAEGPHPPKGEDPAAGGQ